MEDTIIEKFYYNVFLVEVEPANPSDVWAEWPTRVVRYDDIVRYVNLGVKMRNIRMITAPEEDVIIIKEYGLEEVLEMFQN